MKRNYLLAVTIISALVFSGCKSKQEPGKETDAPLSPTPTVTTTQSTPTPTSADTQSTPVPTKEEQQTAADWDESQQQKLFNGYINVNNYILNQLEGAISDYFETVEFQEEFQLLEEKYESGWIGTKWPEDLEKVHVMAEGKPEKDELDNAFLTLYPSLEELTKVFIEIYDYIDTEAYLNDDYAAGKEYHTRLWNALNEYDEIGENFLDRLDVMASERHDKELEDIKNQGYELLYAVNKVIDTAQKIQGEFYEQELTDDTILDMDVAVIKPLYEEYQTYMETVLTYEKDDEKKAEEGFPNDTYFWTMFPNKMEDTGKSISKLIEHAEQQKPLGVGDTMIKTISGNANIGSFETGITDMINLYNSLVE